MTYIFENIGQVDPMKADTRTYIRLVLSSASTHSSQVDTTGSQLKTIFEEPNCTRVKVQRWTASWLTHRIGDDGNQAEETNWRDCKERSIAHGVYPRRGKYWGRMRENRRTGENHVQAGTIHIKRLFVTTGPR